MKKQKNTAVKNVRTGFTLIELSISIVFLATLLISVTILVIFISGIYQKGLALRSVNATGRAIVDDIGRAISASPLARRDDPIFRVDNTSGYFHQRYDNDGLPLFGAFCTGRFTYLWNTAQGIQTNIYLTYEFEDLDGVIHNTADDDGPFRFIRINDPMRAVCRAISPYIPDPDNSPNYRSANPEHCANRNISALEGDIEACFLSITEIDSSPTFLITEDENDLVLFDFHIFPATVSRINNHVYYTGTFILATMRGGINILGHGNYCSDPGGTGLVTDFNYCAINKFSFAMRTTGESRENIDDQFGN